MPPTTSSPAAAGTPRSRGAGLALMGVLVAAAAVFVALVVAVLARASNAADLIGGLFAAAFTSLLFAGLGAWALLTLLRPPRDDQVDGAKAEELAALLGDTLRELEIVRTETARRISARAALGVPAGVALGLAAWIAGLFGDDPSDIVDLLTLTFGGGAVGYFWAAHKLSEAYRRRYKAKVLPALAAQFGALSYRPAISPDLAALRRQRIFREFDAATAEDEIHGTYRGVPVRIVELKLTVGSGKNRRTVFDGLVTELELPRGLSGTTAVIADGGAFGNLVDRMRSSGAERVRLEDPAFEAQYEVYGTDQISARALLTPAFMERFMALSGLPGFVRPLALAEDNRLTVVMSKAAGGDLFEPPDYRKSAASRQALVELHDDVAAVLRLADALIELDHLTSSAARDVAS
ncbi:DUF3137 domain-containing protein [Phenylobacterium sp.]|uniref:DUF3137 domain-containing protein n=1 Tax=Phenylobacterium sp. TaxID=1871053 RepID=UPI002E301A08|nr:DUF3137 domain-containing protein [Phenylobacterium sp.]HEX2562119.1 DUF3137 domain-containing protein [Phenylobacterium sp.]